MLSGAGIDLMNAFLTFDPDRRISANEALQHPWFTEHPLPQNPKRRSMTASSNGMRRPRTRQRLAIRCGSISAQRRTLRCNLGVDVTVGRKRMIIALAMHSTIGLPPTLMLALTSSLAARALQSGDVCDAADGCAGKAKLWQFEGGIRPLNEELLHACRRCSVGR